MKVFVTGGTGFIGSNLVRLLLQEGYAVKVLVRPNSCLNNLINLDIELIQGNLTDPNFDHYLEGCKILFHCAAHYSLWKADKQQLEQYNIIGTRNVLAAARKAGIERTIYTSSVAAIGVKSGLIADETYQSPIEKLVGYYKKSKYWAEQEAQKAIKLGQDIVIVNPSTPIGPGDIKPTPTGDLILRFLKQKMPAYVNTGLNFIDVRDVAKGHLLALEKGKTGERYILGHQNLTLKYFLNLLAETTELPAPQYQVPVWLPLSVAWVDEIILTRFGKSPAIPVDGVKMSTQAMYYDASKAVEELGLPQSPIHIALQDAVNWFITNKYLE